MRLGRKLAVGLAMSSAEEAEVEPVNPPQDGAPHTAERIAGERAHQRREAAPEPVAAD